jgi:hypothetical protein
MAVLTKLPPPRVLLAIYGPALAVLAALALWALAADEPFSFFAREPAIAVRADDCSRFDCAYAGLLSNLGVLGWSAGAVSAGIAAAVSRDRMLAWGAAVTTLLLIDDLFILHDSVWQWVHPRGQQVALALLGAAVIGFVVAFRHQIAATPAGLVVLAGGFIGASTLIDVVANEYLVEDGLKFLGIVSWTAWMVLVSLSRLRPAGRAVEGASTSLPRDR